MVGNKTGHGVLGESPYFNVGFGALLLGFTSYFLFWGLDYTNYSHVILFVLATLFGVFMAFNIGGNDVANAFGTSVGAGTLTIKQALLVAAIFEVSGAVIAGGEVTKTIRKGIVDLSLITIEPLQFVYIMMSALVAAACWLLFASKRGYPVSTTHSIIGGIVGSSIMLGAMIGGSDTALSLVQWGKIGTIAMSWVISPVLGGLVSYALYMLIKKQVLAFNEQAEEQLSVIRQEKNDLRQKFREKFASLSGDQKVIEALAIARDAQVERDPDLTVDDFESEYYQQLDVIEQKKNDVQAYKALETWVPLIAALGSMVISAMLLFKGLKHLKLGLSTIDNYLIMLMVGATIWMATFIFARTLKGKSLSRSTFLLFSWMQVFTAAGFAFSHGANDIANAIGPFAAILDIMRTGEVGSRAAVPTIAMVTFGVAMIAGLWFIGKDVIKTVGHNLTKMHPASGFSAELAAAAVVMLASLLGIPVSSTHILIGAVIGIGLANHNTNWALVKPIGLAWVITLPAAATLSALSFVVLSSIF